MIEFKEKKIQRDFDTGITWVEIVCFSINKQKETVIFAGASSEYLDDSYHTSELQEHHLKDWLQKIKQRWFPLGETIFDQKVHYDLYTNEKKYEINLLNFLINKRKSK